MSNGKVVSAEWLKRYLSPRLKPYWTKKRGKYAGFADEDYYLPTISEINAILGSMSFPPPAKNIFDCDDFAFAFRADAARYSRLINNFPAFPCMGIAWGRFAWVSKGKVDHACNWAVNNNGTFRWVEPQSKTLYATNKCRGQLRLLLI